MLVLGCAKKKGYRHQVDVLPRNIRSISDKMDELAVLTRHQGNSNTRDGDNTGPKHIGRNLPAVGGRDKGEREVNQTGKGGLLSPKLPPEPVNPLEVEADRRMTADLSPLINNMSHSFQKTLYFYVISLTTFPL